MITRYGRSLCLILPVLLGLTGAAGAGTSGFMLSRSTSLSAGSFFAAAQACERRKLTSEGQVAAILADLDQYLSDGDKVRLKQGFAEGARSGRVFIPQQGWIESSVDEAQCARIQAVLDEYKGILDLTLPASGLHGEPAATVAHGSGRWPSAGAGQITVSRAAG